MLKRKVSVLLFAGDQAADEELVQACREQVIVRRGFERRGN
jgi:hypothetical protein